ncbi:hypothetical protein HDU84_000828 [Entophlyctis sp. JEL0112]|nr:hypothetical protein HDU84_000828 [Entophlyctis sp. JEL0112]
MEPLCVAMIEKGFPLSVNAPVTIKGSANFWKYTPRESAKVIDKLKRISVVSSASAAKKTPPIQDPVQNMPSIHLPSYFMVAVGLGLENVVRAMIKRADVNQNWHGLTPLLVASSKNFVGLVQLLLDAGADPSVGILVSQYALLRKLKSIVNIGGNLRAAVETANAQQKSSNQPNDILVATAEPSSAPSSIAETPDQLQKPHQNLPSNQNPVPPLHVTIPSSRTSVVSNHLQVSSPQALASPRSRLDQKSSDRSQSERRKPFLSAEGSKTVRQPPKITGYVFNGQVGSEDKLEAAAAEKRRSSVFHMWNEEFMKDRVIFPVELAAACGHSDLSRILLARMDQKLLAKCTFALLVQRDADLSLLFLRAGVPATQKDAFGSSALHLACRSGNLDLVTAYVESNMFNINCKGQNDWTPLHEAVSVRRTDVAKYLIQSNANIDALNKMQETPKMLGVRLGVPKAELDEIFGNKPTAPPSPDERASPALNDCGAASNANGSKSGNSESGKLVPRLNLMDMMKKTKANAVAAASGKKKVGSFPSLNKVAVSSGKSIQEVASEKKA